MSTPSRAMVPLTRAPGVSSCIRFRVRRNVDLPQPDGPMIAVTARGGIVTFTPRTARNAPYQTSRLTTSTEPLGAPAPIWTPTDGRGTFGPGAPVGVTSI